MKRPRFFFRLFANGFAVDYGFIILLAIGLLAIWPFLAIPSLPQETDAELHIFRLAELSYLIRGGEFYPRWAPNFYHGYGYPIFNYYAPLAYYVGLVFELLPRLDSVAAVKIVFVLGLLLGGTGVYGFVRDNWGQAAGFVAAALFFYAPYVQYVDPHARGVLAESFSFGVFPMALWALDRLRRRQTAVSWAAAVLWITAVILSHNLMALLFFGILVAWAIWQAIISTKGRRQSGLLFAALAVGLAMAAFFWLPVLLERNDVNLDTLIGSGDNYDFHTHFLSIRELFAPSLRLDWGATEPLFRFNVGLAQWVSGLVGIGMLLWRKGKAGTQLAFFVVVMFGLIGLMLPIAAPIWEAVPLLPFFQFPWRLLGPTAVFLAIIGGAGFAAIMDTAWVKSQPRLAQWLPLLAISVPIALGLPFTQPSPWPDFEEVNVLRMSLIERGGRWLGTTSTSDYVPATVDSLPSRNPDVVNPLYDGLPINRINWATTPAVASVTEEIITPLHFQYQVKTPKPFALRLFLFDFPGWTVQINGELVETELGRPEGFIVIPIAEGTHLVDVRFGTTPARTTAVYITIFGLIVMVGVGLVLGRGKRPFTAQPFVRMPHNWRLLIGVVGLTAVVVLIIHPAGWLHDNSSGNIVQPATERVYADFGQQIALLGYDPSSSELSPGDTLNVTIYWKAEQELEINYQSFVHILRPDGSLLAQSDHLNPGAFPTRRWPTDKYVRDTHQLQIPPNAPPGQYTVATGLWVHAEGWRLPLFDNTKAPIGDNFKLFQLTITKAE